jgi:hypothetical protein
LRDGRPQALVDDLLTQAHALHHPTPPRRISGGIPSPQHRPAAHSSSVPQRSLHTTTARAGVPSPHAASTTHPKRVRTRKQPLDPSGGNALASPGSSEPLLQQTHPSSSETERMPPPLLP